jgi:hypothetical protein
MRGVPLGSTAGKARDEALRVSARVRWAYMAAWLTYTAVVACLIIVYLSPTIPWNGRLGIAYAMLAPQFMIATWSIRVPLGRRLLMFAAYLVVGISLLLLLTTPSITVRVVRTVAGPFALFPMLGLLFLFVRRIQPFLILLIASLIHFGGLALLLNRFRPEVTIGSRGTVTDNPWLVVIGLANIALGVIVTHALLRRGWPLRLTCLVAAVAGTVLLDRDLVHHNLPFVVRIVCFLAVAVLQIFILWSLFKVFVWFQERRFLTNDLIQTHLCWAFLTLCFVGSTVLSPLYSNRMGVRWGLLLALLLQAVVLHALLFRIRRQRPSVTQKRLLLLRVFGRAHEREELLDHLNDTWRCLGAIDLLAATDVASRTLQSSMLEAFLLLRSDEQFLSKQNADVRLKHRPARIEGDVRYPVNAVYCYPAAWQTAVTHLARHTSAVLMDVRGFTSRNQGCVWELNFLLHQKDLIPHVVLLADRRTDLQALAQVTQATGLAERKLTVLNFDQKSQEEQRTLFELLLGAAYT